jgi:hypothetical protein
MHDRPSVVALVGSLRAVVASHPARTDPALQTTLRTLVYDVVDDLKDVGWPPERVIVALKLIVAEAGLRASPGVLAKDANLTEIDAVMLNLFAWSLERYFGDALSRRN